ncbi:CGNR zinc finger domain-containing protein [Catenulispora rubra]|uniref:CGNR zinc finger domain-containing protein n=1 Tax=Catenulispora rubra TaxID=280293 RepID=UPI0018925369|nr:CGNR zinc finger domain-containing protein [Catenulispora rubra]
MQDETDQGIRPAGRAPGGLVLVQDLVNTATLEQYAEHAYPGDLLADLAAANRWLDGASARWAAANAQAPPALHLAEADLAPLTRFREAVRALAAGNGEDRAGIDSEAGAGQGEQPQTAIPLGAASLSLRMDGDGVVRHGTTASGWRGVSALVAGEIMLAQHTGTWSRLKTCRYPVCGVAFYDESRNNSRVWHDVRTCGNRTNLAASRQRRRAVGATEQ